MSFQYFMVHEKVSTSNNVRNELIHYARDVLFNLLAIAGSISLTSTKHGRFAEMC